jgi:MoaA/NifB/PqqE/SkfB family radical SAM enzyme
MDSTPERIRQRRVAEVATQRAGRDIQEKGFLRGYLLPKAAMLVVGFPHHAFGSIDLTHRCNLRCEHCYFYEQEWDGELSDEEWLARIRRLHNSKFPFRTCTWVGGEPLLRKDLLEKAKPFFKFNIVVTNGTVPLPDWPEVYYHVSLDGTREIHDKVRNRKGLYEIVKRNADRPDLDVTMVYCISNNNKHCFEEVLAEWKRETRVKGFIFDFYTPRAGADDPLWVPWEERDRIIDRLIELKRAYRDFIAVPARVFELMKSKNVAKVVARCPFERKGFALDPKGRTKSPCMMGEGADCGRCGCVVPFYLTLRTERRHILREAYGDAKAGLRRLLGRAS